MFYMYRISITMTNLTLVQHFGAGIILLLLLMNNSGKFFLFAQPSDETRFAIIVRTDLGMTVGKSATQCAHAVISCYKKALKRNLQVLNKWMNEGQSKVVLKPSAAGENEIFDLAKKAEANRIVSCIVKDPDGTVTAIGIGPSNVAKLNKITGRLKLL